ncbi:OB-fold domain-containing protein [Natrinema sp. SYSU A 869]|uniref:Zn-ribbon domain-containing OB-fold protein n=1 Tax=Natrinema sp. SYSU A 869 TaxID=2871694 RepID=UPI001CA4033A|nr:OB-fold domain-containing protein [Natrinema sp. SYSU A 869]
MSAPVKDRREKWEGPVPVPTGATVPFWAGTLEGDLRYQECECGNRQLYPRAICTSCGDEDPPFEVSEGVGTIYTYTVCHVPGEPGFGDRTPYVVGAIDLVEGPRLLALIDAEPEGLEIGASVAVTFWQISDVAAIPVFVPE